MKGQCCDCEREEATPPPWKTILDEMLDCPHNPPCDSLPFAYDVGWGCGPACRVQRAADLSGGHVVTGDAARAREEEIRREIMGDDD